MDKRFEIPHSAPRWWWEGAYTPACFDCTHFRGCSKGAPRCTAFPEGIPRELMQRDAKHIEPYPNDHGIQFKQYAHETTTA